MANAQTWTIEVELSARGFQAGARRVVSDSGDVDRGTRRAAGGVDRLGKSLNSIKRLVAGVGLSILAREAVRLAVTFDDELTKVNTLVGVSRDQVNAWREDLKRLAPEVGRSNAELARSLFVVTSAGERTGEALRIVERAGKASAVGLGDTAEIARAVTAAIQAYGAENLNAAYATDILVATVREGNLEAGELAAALGRVLGIAAEVGVTFGEVGGFIATFTRLGVNSAEAVTALRALLSSITKPAKETREALASVGLEVSDLRQQIGEQGLARTLINLLRLFEGNEEQLGRVIPNVRALAGVLGTAGSQAQQFLEIEQNVIESTGVLEEAFAGIADTPGHAFRQMQAQVGNLATEFGDNLARGIRDALDQVDGLLDNEEAMADFGRVVGEALVVIAQGLLLVAEHIELVKAAVIALLALRFVAYLDSMIVSLRAAAAAHTLAELATLDWRTAIWAVRSGYIKFFAMDVATKLRMIATSTNLIAAAAVALALGLDKLIDKWRKSSEEAINYLIQLNELEKALAQLERAARANDGKVTAALFKAGEEAAAGFREEIKRLQKEIDWYYRDTSGRGAGFDPRLRGVDAPSLKPERLQEAEKHLRQLQGELGRLEKLLGTVEVVAEEAGDGIETGLGGGAGAATRDLKGLLSELELILGMLTPLREEFESLSRMNEALQLARTAEELELIALAAEMGIDPVAALNESFTVAGVAIRPYLEHLLALRAAVEANTRAAEEYFNTLGQGRDLELPEVELEIPEFEPILDDDTLERQARSWEDFVRNRVAGVWNNFVEGMQDIFRDTFRDLFRGTLNGFEDLWDSVLNLALDTLAEIAAQWAAQQFTMSVTGTGTGGGGGFFSSLFGGGGGTGGGGGSGSSVAAWGAVAAIVGAILWDAGVIGSKGSEGVGGVAIGDTGDGGLGVLGAWANRSKNIRVVMEKVKGAIADVADFLEAVNLEIERFGETTLEKRDQTYYLNGISLAGKTAAEIQDAVAAMAIRTAEFGSSVSRFVQAVIEGSRAMTTEQLKAEIEFARMVDAFGSTGLEQQIRSVGDEMRMVFDELVRLLGDNIEQLSAGLNKTVLEEVHRWQSVRDEIVGRQMTQQELMEIKRREAELFNAELALRIAELKARKEELEGIARTAQVRMQLTQNELQGRAQLLAAEADLVGRHFRVLGNIVQVSAETLNAQIRAINDLIAALEAIPPIDVGEIRLPGGGGRNQKRVDREQLAALLDTFERGLLGVAGAVEEVNARWIEAAELAHGQADLLERVAAARRAELEALQESEVLDPLREFLSGGGVEQTGPNSIAIMPTELEGGLFGMTELEQQAQAIRDRFAEILAANEALAAAESDLYVDRKLILEAERRAMRQLADDVIAGLGLPLEQTRAQVQQWAEALDFLEQQVADGIVSIEELGMVVAQLGQQAFLQLGDALLGFVERYYGDVAGFEEFRRQLEATRFQLEYANLLLQFELVRDLGILTEAQIRLIEETFDWIEANWPDFEAGLPPYPVVVPPPSPSPTLPTPAAPTAPGPATTGNELERDMERLMQQLRRWQDLSLSSAERELQALYDTRDEMLALAESLGYSTEEVLAAFQVALDDFWQRMRSGLQQLFDSMLTGPGSPLSAGQQLTIAQQRFDELAARLAANPNDLEALEAFDDAAADLLAAAQAYTGGTGPLFTSIFNMVRNALAAVLGISLPGIGGPRDDVADELTAAVQGGTGGGGVSFFPTADPFPVTPGTGGAPSLAERLLVEIRDELRAGNDQTAEEYQRAAGRWRTQEEYFDEERERERRNRTLRSDMAEVRDKLERRIA